MHPWREHDPDIYSPLALEFLRDVHGMHAKSLFEDSFEAKEEPQRRWRRRVRDEG